MLRNSIWQYKRIIENSLRWKLSIMLQAREEIWPTKFYCSPTQLGNHILKPYPCSEEGMRQAQKEIINIKPISEFKGFSNVRLPWVFPTGLRNTVLMRLTGCLTGHPVNKGSTENPRELILGKSRENVEKWLQFCDKCALRKGSKKCCRGGLN